MMIKTKQKRSQGTLNKTFQYKKKTSMYMGKKYMQAEKEK